jgi:hypothetical protein
MYVFCVGMYRACSTWQYEVVCHLLEKHRGARRLGYVSGEQFGELDDKADDTWKVLKSHDGHPHFTRALNENRALVVYAFRDLRDVAFSLMHKFSASFDEVVVEKRFLQACIASDHYWTTQPNIVCQRYEALMFSPVDGVKALAEHLGIELTQDEAHDVAEEYSLRANLWRTIELKNRLREEGVDLNDPASAALRDEHSLLHWNHIRSGQVGGWREKATPEQLEILARVCGPWLIARSYETDQAWAMPALDNLRKELEATRQKLADCKHILRDTRIELATTQDNLYELQEEHCRTLSDLNALESLGPVALGVARKVHHASVRYPRLVSTLKRVLRSEAAPG